MLHGVAQLLPLQALLGLLSSATTHTMALWVSLSSAAHTAVVVWAAHAHRSGRLLSIAPHLPLAATQSLVTLGWLQALIRHSSNASQSLNKTELEQLLCCAVENNSCCCVVLQKQASCEWPPPVAF